MKNFIGFFLLIPFLAWGAPSPQLITATAPLTLTSGNLSILSATTGRNGYLTSGDWTTFNAKLTSPLTTKGDLLGFSSLPARLAVGTNGDVLIADSSQTLGVKWGTPSGVTSVALALPNIFNISGSPVTTTGTLTGTLATQTANTVFSGPTTGSAATPAFRALVGADLPNPSASTLGGVESYAAVTNQWINAISTSGVPSSAQPAFSNISGSVTAAQLPNPSSSTLGGIQSYAAVSNQWINTISTLGVPSSSQPAFSNLSGSVASTQMPALTGDVTSSAGTVATTVAKIQTTTVSGTTGSGNVVFSASPTLTGTAVLASGTVSGSLKTGNYHIEPSENDAGNSSTAQTIDWSTGSAQKSTLTGSVTYTFSNPQTGGAYVLKIATGAGSFTVAWPVSVKWSGGTAPTITATAGRIDLVNFYYDGTNYYGSYVQNFTP